MRSELGILVDITAIAAVVILAVFGKLPESVVAVVVTMVVAGRFKPPDPIVKLAKQTDRPPPIIPPESSGILLMLASIYRLLGK